jgi:hypothetical protein
VMSELDNLLDFWVMNGKDQVQVVIFYELWNIYFIILLICESKTIFFDVFLFWLPFFGCLKIIAEQYRCEEWYD